MFIFSVDLEVSGTDRNEKSKRSWLSVDDVRRYVIEAVEPARIRAGLRWVKGR